jgi:hypothetical protein
MNQIQEEINQAFNEFKSKVESHFSGGEEKLRFNISIHQLPDSLFTDNASTQKSFDEISLCVRSYKVEHIGEMKSITLFSAGDVKKFKEVTE